MYNEADSFDLEEFLRQYGEYREFYELSLSEN